MARKSGGFGVRKIGDVSHYALACALGVLLMAPCVAAAQARDTTIPPSAAASAQSTSGTSTVDRARAAEASTPLTSQVSEVVVTAQKRLENVQNIGMSIQAASGDALVKLGVTDTRDLVKVVPGLTFTGGFSGVPVYSIRGVGYFDTSLEASPAVSINEDEVPLPFSVESAGSTLDLQRVEVLKGPQGTLFGENATGGAINYIAAKPTDHFDAGFNASYGRFNTANLEGYVSGPVTDALDLRLALKTIQSDGWQESQSRPGDTLGAQDFTTGRLSALWKPTGRLQVLATLSGFLDNSQSQAPQFYADRQFSANPLVPGFASHPFAPENDRVADWDVCINTSATILNSQDKNALPNRSQCVDYSRNTNLLKGALRIDYDLTGSLTLTSLTSYQHLNYYNPYEADGTDYTDYSAIDTGHLNSFYQELRLSGQFLGRGSWIVGGNFEDDGVEELDHATFDQSSLNPIPAIPGLASALTVGDSDPFQKEHSNSYAGFAHGEYPITPNLTLNSGVRFTQTNISDTGTVLDAGNGAASALAYESQLIDQILSSGKIVSPPVLPSPGGATSLGPAPNFVPGYFHGRLDQNNVSWRVGLDWKITPLVLLYGNVSKGYKAGSFPELGAQLQSQYTPVTQESLLAYEVGFKTNLLDRTLQLNGAGFYYDYDNKQILGDTDDAVFGALPILVNIPKSHVVGFEFSGIWRPIEGLTITPSVSYAHSEIDGCAGGDSNLAVPGCHDGKFYTYNYLPKVQSVTGERFPEIPQVQADLDAQYEWAVRNDLQAFIGSNVNYQGSDNSSFGDFAILNVQSYVLLDLRAGIEKANWRVQLWGRNVLNQFYVNNNLAVVDAYTRYTGMPATYGVTVSYRFK